MVFKQSFFYIYFLIVPLFSFLTTFFLINPIKKLSLRLGFFDEPDERKQHSNNIVRLGGVSIYIGFLVSFIALYLNDFSHFYNNSLEFETTFLKNIFIGSGIFFVLGLLDDLFKISPFFRLFIQLLTVFVLSFKGLRFDAFDLAPLNNSFKLFLPRNISIFINIIWVVGITNAINWLDGIDGLTSMYVSLMLSSLFIISFSKGLFLIAFVLIVLIFSILGFYKHNKYPAKIIMGDGGTYFLGFILSTFSVFLSFNKESSYSLLIPITLLSIPILDMIFVILRRLLNKKSIFFPDRSHLHHRLQAIGLTYQKTLNILILLFGFSSLLTLLIYLSISN